MTAALGEEANLKARSPHTRGLGTYDFYGSAFGKAFHHDWEERLVSPICSRSSTGREQEQFEWIVVSSGQGYSFPVFSCFGISIEGTTTREKHFAPSHFLLRFFFSTFSYSDPPLYVRVGYASETN
jgi:hypothetical protein